MSTLKPTGLPSRNYGSFAGKNDATVILVGAEANAEAGTVTVDTGQLVNVSGAVASGQSGTITTSFDFEVTLTGAEVASGAGTTSAGFKAPISLSPLGLAIRKYSTFTRDVDVTLIGFEASAEGGNVQAQGIVGMPFSQLGPWGLTTKARIFTNKDPAGIDVFINVFGAQVEAQAANPDSSNVNIYIDGIAAVTGAGSVSQSEPEIVGFESQAQAGIVTSAVSIDAIVAGFEVQAIAADVFAVDGIGVNISGAESQAQAGSITLFIDSNIALTGAQSVAESSAVGIDDRTDIAATVSGAEAQGLAQDMALVGPHVVLELIGVEAQGLAGTVESLVELDLSNLAPHRVVFDSASRSIGFSSASQSVIMESIDEPVFASFLLLESGDFLLLESGDKLVLEE